MGGKISGARSLELTWCVVGCSVAFYSSMKTSRTEIQTRNGFTLIELLVVITILGILMSMAVGGTSAIKEQSRSAQARTDVTGVAIAIKAFYNDYSRYPVPGTKTDDTPFEPQKGAEGNKEVLNILVGADTTLNPRGQVYYEGKSAKAGKDGGPINGLSKEGGLFDPWGFTYGILVDGDYDQKLKYDGAAMKDLDDTARIVSGGAGVFSLGPKQKKPILSWQ